MFKIDLKPGRKTSAIMLVSYYLPKQRLTWGTGISIAPKDWDAAKHTIKKTHKEHIWLNAKLFKYREVFEQTLADYRITNQAQPPHDYLKAKLNDIRDRLDGRAAKSPSTKPDKITFVQYCEDFIERMKASPKYAERTHYHYLTTLNNLKLYAHTTKAALDWSAFTYAWFEDWQNWAFLEVVKNADGKVIKDQLSQNSMAGYWKKFKHMLISASEDGHYKGADHLRPSLAIGFQESDQVYFPQDELMQLYHLQLDDPRLEAHRDWALFNAFCGGFRFADLDAIGSKSNVVPMAGADTLRFRTSKTDTEVVVPGHWYYAEFVAKYNGKWPEIGSNQKFNESIKELAMRAGLDYPVTRRINKGGSNMWETRPKHELVHQYTLRYSYATNLDEAGVAIQDIMRLMGHTNIKTTMRYIKTKAHQSALRVAGNAYFTTKPEPKPLKASQA
jgi:site-specific recombinase XerC